MQTVSGPDWRPSELFTVAFPFLAGHRPDHENDNEAGKELNLVDIMAQLDVLDFADDLALLSHDRQQMQDNTIRLLAVSCKGRTPLPQTEDQSDETEYSQHRTCPVGK